MVRLAWLDVLEEWTFGGVRMLSLQTGRFCVAHERRPARGAAEIARHDIIDILCCGLFQQTHLTALAHCKAEQLIPDATWLASFRRVTATLIKWDARPLSMVLNPISSRRLTSKFCPLLILESVS